MRPPSGISAMICPSTKSSRAPNFSAKCRMGQLVRGQTKRRVLACLEGGPVHRRLEKQSANSLPAPFRIDKQGCIQLPLKGTVASLDKTRQFFREIYSGHPPSSRQSRAQAVADVIATRFDDVSRRTTQLAGSSEQIQNCTLVAKTKILKDQAHACGHTGIPEK